MGELREIVTVEQVQTWFVWLAIGAPPIGLLVGALAGRRAGCPRRGAAAGLAVGLLGPLNLGLWFIYNAISERLGMDTVRNLLVNLALFVMLGGVMGFVAARLWIATAGDSAAPGERSGTPVGGKE